MDCKPSQFDTLVHPTSTTDLFFWPASSQLTVVFPFSHITAGWRADLEKEKSGFLFLKRRILSCKRNGLILLNW